MKSLAPLRLLPAIVLFLSLPAFGHAQTSEGPGTPARPLRVCACETSFFHPTEATDAPAGLEADLLEGFAESIDRRFEVVWLDPCRGHDVRLEQGDCEVVATRLTWTAERATHYALTSGYLPVRMVLVQRDGYVEADDQPMRVAALADTLNSRAADELPSAKTVPMHDEAEMFRRLANGDIDALVCDTAVVLDYIADYPDVVVREFLDEGSHYSFALALESDLLEPLDGYLAAIKADGRYEALLVEHFGADLVATLAGIDE